MPKQTITKAQLAKILTGSIWNIVRYASWSEFKPMAASIERRFRIVYWAAWHWRLLDELHAALTKATAERYASTIPSSPHSIKRNEATRAVLPNQEHLTEYAPTERVAGLATRHASVALFWRDYKMPNFPEQP